MGARNRTRGVSVIVEWIRPSYVTYTHPTTMDTTRVPVIDSKGLPGKEKAQG